MKTKSSVLCFAMVLTALVAMNGAAQDAGKAAREPGLYADDAFIGDASLSEAAEYLTNSARDGVHYTIVLGNDDKANAVKLDYGKKQTQVTLTTSGGKHTVTYDRTSPTAPLFTVGAGVTFTLEEGVTLSGSGSGSWNVHSLVHINGGEFIMNGGEISANSSSFGGGVYVSSGSFTMSGGEISGNSASYSGGGVYMNNGSFTMSGGAIIGNTAKNRNGGGVCVDRGSFTMSGGEISGNSATHGSVYVDRGSFTMSGGEVSGNSAKNTGGGVRIESGEFIMSGGEISGNSAPYSGGGVYMSSGSFTMSGGAISGNSTKDSGGGVYVWEGTFTQSDGEISGNSAATSGGGVYVSSSFTMSGGEMSGNTAKSNGGGVFVGGKGTFTKSGTAGIIYGSNGPKGKANLAKSNKSGHAVFGDGDSQKVRNTTADEATAIDTSKSRLAGGGWERPTDTPEASSAQAKTMRVTMDTSKLQYLAKEGRYETLGLRDQPGATGRVLGRLSRGDRVTILQEGGAATIDGMRSNWVQVEVLSGALAGQKGWLFKGYLDE